MAAIDTIEVLDNLQFQHLDTADIYTVHADGMAGESVKTHAITLPAMDILAARVIINNNYGATGSQVHARVRLTGATSINGLVKSQSVQPLEWTAVALGAAVESADIDLTDFYSALLHVDIAITGTTAHLGTEIIVQIRKEATVDEWTEWARLVSCSGLTAFKTDVLSTANAGQKVIPVNNPTAGNLNHIMKNIFILDATVANSEICFQTACGADA
jgi:hypothetical protein